MLLGRFPQEPVRDMVESRLRETFGPGSSVGSVRVIPGTLWAELGDVVVDAEAFRLSASRLTVRLDRRMLTGGGVHLRELRAAGLEVELRTAEEGAPASAPPTGPVRIDTVDVSGARLRWRDPAMPGEVRLDGVSASGSVGLGTLRLAVAGGTWTREPPVVLAPAEAVLAIGEDLALTVQSFSAGVGASRVTASGTLGRPGALQPDLRFEGRLVIPELLALAGRPSPEVTGEILVTEGRVTGSLDAPRVGASFGGRLGVYGGAADVRGRREPGGRVEATVGARNLDLARLRAHGVPSSVRGRADVELSVAGDPRVPLEVRATVRSHGHSDAQPFDVVATGEGTVGTDGDVDLGWTMHGGTTQGRLTARGHARGLPSSLTLTGDFDATPAAGVGPEGTTARGSFSSRGTRLGAQVVVNGLGSPVHVDVDLAGGVARRFIVDGAAVDLARLSPEASGQGVVRLDLHGALSALAGTGSVTVNGLRWADLDLGDVAARIDGERGRFRVDLSAPMLAASADLTASTSTRRLAGTIRTAGTSLALLDPTLEGNVTGTVVVDVPLDDPLGGTATAVVTALDARQGEWQVRNVDALELALRDRVLHLVRVAVETTGARLRAHGHVDLHGMPRADVSVDADADLAQLPLPNGTRASGIVTVAATLTGTREAPRARGTARLGPFSVETAGIPPVTSEGAVAEIDGDRLRLLPFTLGVASGTARVEGEMPFDAAGTGWLAASWDGVSIADLLAAARPGATAGVEASVAGSLEVRGQRADPQGAEGSVHAAPFVARVNELPVEVGALVGRLEGGHFDVDPLTVTTSGSTIEARAAVDLVRREMDVVARGALDLRAVSPFLDETALTGTATVDVTAKGPWASPRVAGQATLAQGSARLRALPQALTDIGARLDFDGATVRLTGGTARLGGGPLTANGSARLADGGLLDVGVDVTARDVALRYPPGLWTRLGADVRLAGTSGALRLTGDVRVARGLYDLDVALEDAVRAAAVPVEDSPALRSMGLDLRVTTEAPIAVRSNIVDILASGNLQVRGDAFAPAPIGTLRVLPGGRVYLQGRELRVSERSRGVTYDGTWDPALHVEAVTVPPIRDASWADVEVTATVLGTMLRPRLTLDAPGYSDAQIMALLATGDSRGSAGAAAVGGQAAALVAGRLGRQLRGLGLEEVSLQPELVVREGDVQAGARFTFGKRLTGWARVLYSANLQSPEERWLQLETEASRADLRMTFSRTDEGRFSTGVGQRFRFGGPPPPPPSAAAEAPVRLDAVRLSGEHPLGDDALRVLLGVKEGDRRTIWQLQDRAEAARDHLVRRGHIEAEVSARLDGSTAVFDVQAGPRYVARVTGLDDPPSLDATIRSALFAEDALDGGRARLLRDLYRRGHLRAVVDTSVAESVPGERELVFAVRPGPRLTAVVSFPGAATVAASELQETAGGAGRLLADPEGARAAIAAHYRARHHAAAEVGPVQVQETDGTVRLTVPVSEGPRARLAAVEIRGATRAEPELQAALALTPGMPWEPLALDEALGRLQGHYYGLGHPDVRLALGTRTAGPDVVAEVTVVEGPRVDVGEVRITGLRRTREGMVRRRLTLAPGDPLDPRELPLLERAALDLGTFARATATTSGSPAVVTLEVEEGERLRSHYELRWDEEEHGSVLVDAEVRNVFGIGLGLGARQRVGTDLRESIASVFVPSLLRGGRLTLRAFHLEEDLPPIEPDAPEDLFQQKGGAVEQQLPLGSRWELLTGYSFRRTSTTFSNAPPFVANLAALDVSLLRDTRDDPMDARSGLFTSLSLRHAPSGLGSDFTYGRGLAQVFAVRPLGERLSWAQGLRLGLAKGYGGQRVRSTERFRSGGGNSVRGFATDRLGPLDFQGEPSGGEAVLVLNEELRLHHPSGLGAVLFWDAGEVWSAVSEMNLDVRHAVGAGLRYRSSVGLLRLDVGRPLGRREGEKAWRLHVSLGQAF